MALIVRSSQLHAAGVFTLTPIRKGSRIVEYTGPRVPKNVADEHYEDREVTYLFALEDGRVVDGHGTAAFINHSCEPNCETEEDEDARIWIVAKRNIKAGQELTYDYNLFDGEGDAPCYCGSRRCRGSLYSREELRKRRRAGRRTKTERAA